MRKVTLSDLIYCVFGLILLTSVAFKIAGSREVSLVSASSTLPDVSLLIVGAELLVGLWIISGVAAQVGRFVAILLLLAFLTVNLVGAYKGEPSCGCFGAVKIPPLYVAIAEAMYVVALVRLPVKSAWSAADGHALWVVGLVATLFAGYLGLGYWMTGRLVVDWPGLEAEAQFVQHVPQDDPGITTNFELTWVNRDVEPVQLTYLKASCGCMQTRALPRWVAPGETVRIPVTFTSPTATGQFRVAFAVLTTTTTLRGFVHGHVRNPAGVRPDEHEAP